MHKPTIAISRCLLGDAVRYDGADKFQPQIETLILKSAEFSVLPFCPEVAIGLGVPRPPVQLVSHDTIIRATGVEDKNIDISDALIQYAKKYFSMHTLHGVINKKGSPSCANQSARLFMGNTLIHEQADGLFVATLKLLDADLPLIDEQQFTQQERRAEFIRRVFERYKKSPH